MNLGKYFDISRFWLLLKVELFRSRKAIGMTFVIILGLLFTGLILESIFGTEKIYSAHADGYAFNLIVAGFILSSLAFNDLGNTLKRYHYLTLPVSTLEKFLSMWLLTTVGWITLFSVVFFIYTQVANVLGHILFSYKTYIAFDLLGNIPVGAIHYYFVLQGIFLVGAVHFKGYVFPKTLFTVILFGAVCGIIAYYTMSDLFETDADCMSDANVFLDMPVYKVWTAVQWLFWWMLAPLCWVITYVGLKEQEV